MHVRCCSIMSHHININNFTDIKSFHHQIKRKTRREASCFPCRAHFCSSVYSTLTFRDRSLKQSGFGSSDVPDHSSWFLFVLWVVGVAIGQRGREGETSVPNNWTAVDLCLFTEVYELLLYQQAVRVETGAHLAGQRRLIRIRDGCPPQHGSASRKTLIQTGRLGGNLVVGGV